MHTSSGIKVFFVVLLTPSLSSAALCFHAREEENIRRKLLTNCASIMAGLTFNTPFCDDQKNANAISVSSGASGGLVARLSQRDPSALKNSMFNIPPAAQVYPDFMRGEWKGQSQFNGFLFPSKTVAKDKIISNVLIPGFQKCSIASVCDVGKDLVTYQMKIDQKTGLEDRSFNLAQIIDANLGYKAVDNVIYDPKTNPNRISIDFVKYKTRNAERIELFCNARESELVQLPTSENNASSLRIFVCSEYIRQVTFSYSQEFGVARQVVGNYAQFWTWREQVDESTLTGNVLTAAYLDPQDPLFFEEPSKPVVVYSHTLSAKRNA